MLYARVSPKGSDWNAEETSVAMQIQEMKEYILRRDPQAEFMIETDEFRTGGNLQRPGIQKILADLDQPEPPWGTLVIWALDRLSRSLGDAVPIFEKLRDAGRGFICIRQDYLSTQGAMARFTLNQTILVAQLEREMTAERVKAKMVWIAEKGKVPSGRLPLGYRRKEGVKNEIEPDPETAPIVQDIFQRYLAQTEPIVEIKKRHPQYLLNNNQLYRMLRNRIYIGEIEYDGKVYPGLHSPIIDRDLFDKVGTLLPGSRRAPRPGAQKYQYLLQGLVFCHCGRKMVPYSVTKKNSTRYFYYKCQDTVNCKFAVNAVKLDEEVLRIVSELLMDPEYLRSRYEEYRRQLAEQKAGNKSRIDASAAAIIEVEKEVKNIEDLFLSGVVTPANAGLFNARLTAANQRLALLREQHKELIEALQDVPPQNELSALLDQIQTWADLLRQEGADFTVKRNLILAIVRYVKCINSDGDMEMSIVMTKNKKWRLAFLFPPAILKGFLSLKLQNFAVN